MADLIQHPQDYAAQIAEAARIPSEMAQRYAEANLGNQEAQKTQLANILSRLKLPVQQRMLQKMLEQENAAPEDFSRYVPQQAPPEIPGMGGPQGPGAPQGGAPPAPGLQPTSTAGVPPMGGQTSGSSGGDSPNTYIPTGDTNTQGGMTTSGQDAPTKYEDGEALKGHQIGSIRDQAATFAQGRFAPVPDQPPSDVANKYAEAQRAEAMGLVGPGYADSVLAPWKAFVSRANQQKQYDANKAYSNALLIHSAYQQGNDPRIMLNLLEKELGEALPQHTTAGQIDDLATHFGAEIFRYTGRDVVGHADGNFYDNKGNRILGNNTKVGMDPEKFSELVKAAMNPSEDVTIGDAQGGHTIQVSPYEKAKMTAEAQGQRFPYTTASQWVAEQAAAGASVNPLDQQGGAEGGSPPPRGGRGFVPTQATEQGGEPQVPQPAQTGGSSRGNGGQPITGLTKPIDASPGNIPASYRAPRVPKFGKMANPEKYQEYVKDAQTAIQTNDINYNQARQGRLLDQDILKNQLPNSTPGPAATGIASWQTFLQNLIGKPGSDLPDPIKIRQLGGDPASTQIINKRLNQIGVSDVAELFKGAGGMRGSAMMANLSISQLSGNVNLQKQAISYLVKWDIANKLYQEKKYGDDFAHYQQSGGREDKYDTWYGEHGRNIDTTIPGLMRRIGPDGSVRDIKGTAIGGYAAQDKRGWQLLNDNKGNFAYVNPDNPEEHEEIDPTKSYDK